MDLGLKAKGQACAEPRSFGSRSLRPAAGSRFSRDRGVSSGLDAGSFGEEIALAQFPGNVYGDAIGGRRISTGIISDIRGARGARGTRGGQLGGNLGGCGVPGCGHGGQFCSGCLNSAAAKLAAKRNPYGPTLPHTNPAAGQQPQSGIAPQYAYPYYTTRGPRDFLRDNPPSIGR